MRPGTLSATTMPRAAARGPACSTGAWLIAVVALAFPCNSLTADFPAASTARPIEEASESARTKALVRAPPKKLPAAYYAEIAEIKFRYGLSAEAVELYRKAIDLATDPRDKLQYQIGLAPALEASGASPDADKLWDDLAKSGEPAVAGRAELHLASVLATRGQVDDAVARLEKVALGSPIRLFRQSASRSLVDLLKDRPDRGARLDNYKGRLRKEPKNKELLQLVLDLEAEDAAARVATLKEVAQANPQDLDVKRLLGEALMAAGMRDEAEQVYADLAKNYPGQEQFAGTQLARIALEKGDAAKAEQLVLQGAARIPEGPRKSLYLARAYLEVGLSVPAEKSARDAYDHADSDAFKAAAAMELGDALFRQRKMDEALKYLEPLTQQELWRALQTRAKEIVAQIKASPVGK